MRRDVRALLHDVQRACGLLTQFVDGASLEDYLGDPLLRSAVERQFAIIGEAMNRATRVDSSIQVRISNAQRIIDFRHVLVHGYAVVDDEVVWGIVVGDMSVLASEVEALLRELDAKA